MLLFGHLYIVLLIFVGLDVWGDVWCKVMDEEHLVDVHTLIFTLLYTMNESQSISHPMYSTQNL